MFSPPGEVPWMLSLRKSRLFRLWHWGAGLAVFHLLTLDVASLPFFMSWAPWQLLQVAAFSSPRRGPRHGTLARIRQ